MEGDDAADRPTVGSTVRAASGSFDDSPALSTFERSGERFAIGEELGRGGMGRVVAATDIALDRAVAIKQVLSADAPDLIRFEREVRITAQLEHPSIVPIHEAGIDTDGRPYYVMRRIEGEPLAERIARTADVRGRLALVPNMLAVVDAAAFAHAREIIHRDIKPANILLGAYGETLLIDWGLARRIDEELDTPAAASEPTTKREPLTRAGDIYGTVGYMSSEQARGERVDARADVYALGSTLFHVLTGKAPWEGMSVVERIASAALGREEPPLDRIGPEVPPELVAIVGKAMASDLDVRYRDASELASDLRAFLAGQLVAAHRYTTIERIARFVRRHRVAVAVGGAALLAIVVVSVLAITGIMRARDRAEHDQLLAADRAEAMLLDQASTLATRDPTRSVALLRYLPVGSPNMRRARDIASVAAANGVAHGVSSTTNDSVNVLRISPDGRWLAAVGETGWIRISELATGKTRSVPGVGANTTEAVWTDHGTTITLNAPKGVFVVDIASGARRSLDPEAVVRSLWPAGSDDRIRYIDTAQRVLVERSTRPDGSSRILARDVDVGTGVGELALLLGNDTARLIDGDREIVLGPAPSKDASALGLAISKTRAAAAVGGDVIEWSVPDGRELHRWHQQFIMSLVYGPVLYGALYDGTIVRFDRSVVTMGRHDGSSMSWAGATPGGAAFAFDDGVLMLVDSSAVHQFPFDHPTTRAIGTALHSNYVAVGTRYGLVRWWNMEHMLGRYYEQSGSWCAANATTIYLIEPFSLHVIDRASGAARTISHPFQMGSLACRGLLGNKLVITEQAGTTGILDLASSKLIKIPTPNGIIVNHFANTLLYARDRQLLERAGGDGPERVLWSAPETIGPYAVFGRWIVVNAGTAILRFDRTTQTVITIGDARADVIGTLENGNVWWSVGAKLWWWDGTTSRMLRELPSPILEPAPIGDQLGLRLVDGSLWITDGQRVVNREVPSQKRVCTFGPKGRVASSDLNGRVVLHYLVTGERISRSGRADGFGIDDANHLILVASGRNVLVYSDPVPDDPEQLRGWIDSATNVLVDYDTGELTWK